MLVAGAAFSINQHPHEGLFDADRAIYVCFSKIHVRVDDVVASIRSSRLGNFTASVGEVQE